VESARAAAATKRIKYVFLDVVAFSQGRSVEAQTQIIVALNEAVKGAVADASIIDAQVIYLPTGDGICAAILDSDAPYDAHLTVALGVLKRIRDHNAQAADKMREFDVRIGLNENVDNMVTDINGMASVAGAGINAAQRAMSLADGGQIIATSSVYETLRHREQYMDAFTPYDATVKHDERIRVYQYVVPGHAGLNMGIPSVFAQPSKPERHLDLFEAYYLAHAARQRAFIESLDPYDQERYAASMFLYLLAKNSEDRRQSSRLSPHESKIHGGDSATGKDAFDYYCSLDFAICIEFEDFVEERLSPLSECFDCAPGHSCLFVNKRGLEKLKVDHPDIWAEFGFEQGQ
jgi:class 3 adenylate cyclase